MKLPISSGSITPREKEVLRLVASDYSTTEISQMLGISSRTVETHRKNIIKKINNNSLAAMTRYAIMLGLLEGFAYLPAQKNKLHHLLSKTGIKSNNN
jgi:DNA-binding CsgD family transcriptional regulator